MLRLVELLEELSETSSLNKKKGILESWPDCAEMIQFALDPFMMFNVTSKNLVDGDDQYGSIGWEDEAKPLLLKLFNREITGNAALEEVNDLLASSCPESVDAFKRILDKDLKVGVGAKLVNKVWKKHVPQFDVQLCNKYEKLDQLPFENTFVSRKLDGIRVVAIRQDGNWKFFSRTGKEFTTLRKLEKSLLDSHCFDIVKADIVLDGECCIVDENGNEDFTAAVSQIKRKDHTIKHPKYLVFDMITLTEFASGVSLYKFDDRFKKMKQLFGCEHDHFEVLPQYRIETPKELQDWVFKAQKNNWEGLILRNGDVVYRGKRTNDLLKVKKMIEHEFKIVGYEEGENQFQGMLGALRVEGEYDGEHIRSKVGSGYSRYEYDRDKQGKIIPKTKRDGQRVTFWKARKKLTAKMVTVQFFEISKDKKGDYSLRFPVFKALHGEVRDT